MSLTHIDCFIFRGNGAPSDSSSFVAVNPRHVPGSLVVANALAARESISSQVACKLALEHFLDGVLDYYSGGPENNGATSSIKPKEYPPEISLEVLEAAFK